MTLQDPLDDFRKLIAELPGSDDGARMRVLSRAGTMARRGSGLGRLGEIAGWRAAWSGHDGRVALPVVALFAGTHSIAARLGFGDDVASMVEDCASGAAAISRLCGARELGLKVFDLALDHPVGDIAFEPAMDGRGCAATLAFGMEASAGGTDLLCLGAVGRSGRVSAASIMATLHGGAGSDWLDASREPELCAAVDSALALHGGGTGDPLSVLGRLGGREIAAICGAIAAARVQKVPVVLDGMVAASAAMVLRSLRDDAIEHCVVASLPEGEAGERIAGALGLKPMLDLATGEGTGIGAALGAGLVRDAAAITSPA
jgi:nicotinate-nucleotide--dimethylbenzimidazole phosphoribosyltransferase